MMSSKISVESFKDFDVPDVEYWHLPIMLPRIGNSYRMTRGIQLRQANCTHSQLRIETVMT
jgi:hypothetical protein